MRRVLIVAVACLGLTGCGKGEWFGESSAPPLPGKRIAVLDSGSVLKADARMAQTEILLPAPLPARDWPQ